MNYFKGKPNSPNTKHDCCDIFPADVKPADETVEMATLVNMACTERGQTIPL